MKRIRWGIFGTGTVAGHFAAALAIIPNAELLGVSSRSGDRARAFARNFGVSRAYGNAPELVEDDEIDVVYVATPNSTHKDLAILALEHGKAVLCEKPFALTGEEARAIAAVARRTGRFCMEGMWMRFVPLMREVTTMVRRGSIGTVRLVTATIGFPRAPDAGSRLFNPALGGGVMLDLGVYALSFAFQFLGQPNDVLAKAVMGPSGVDEQASVLLGFPNDAQACLCASFRCRLSNVGTIHGNEGLLRVGEPLYCPESANLERTSQHRTHGPEEHRPRRFDRLRQLPLVRDAYARLRRARAETVLCRRRLGNGYAHEALEVMRCVDENARESPIMPLDESVAIMETMDRIRSQWMRTSSDLGT
jgi:predicted dehydrogenase